MYERISCKKNISMCTRVSGHWENYVKPQIIKLPSDYININIYFGDFVDNMVSVIKEKFVVEMILCSFTSSMLSRLKLYAFNEFNEAVAQVHKRVTVNESTE